VRLGIADRVAPPVKVLPEFVGDAEGPKEPLLLTGVVILRANSEYVSTSTTLKDNSQEVIEFKSLAYVPCCDRHSMRDTSQAECTPCIRALAGGRESINHNFRIVVK
jgi:hypothetical protein